MFVSNSPAFIHFECLIDFRIAGCSPAILLAFNMEQVMDTTGLDG